MKSIFKIRKNTTGKVRLKLCIEDVEFRDKEVLEGFGLITKVYFNDMEDENVLYFANPFHVPKFNKFYASRIKTITDPYLKELIQRILYLNPHPDKLMIKKITECIILQFSVIEMRESQVSSKEIAVPVLRFEEVEPIVVFLVAEQKSFYKYPDNQDIVMFHRDSKFSPVQKMRIKAICRGEAVKERMESAIHIAAEHLIDVEVFVKITAPRIENTKMVVRNGNITPAKTIRKYMGERTKRVIEEHNSYAPFKSEKSADKYKEFLALDHINMSLDEMVYKLGVSKSRAVEFRRMYQQNYISLPEV